MNISIRDISGGTDPGYGASLRRQFQLLPHRAVVELGERLRGLHALARAGKDTSYTRRLQTSACVSRRSLRTNGHEGQPQHIIFPDDLGARKSEMQSFRPSLWRGK